MPTSCCDQTRPAPGVRTAAPPILPADCSLHPAAIFSVSVLCEINAALVSAVLDSQTNRSTMLTQHISTHPPQTAAILSTQSQPATELGFTAMAGTLAAYVTRVSMWLISGRYGFRARTLSFLAFSRSCTFSERSMPRRAVDHVTKIATPAKDILAMAVPMR